MKCIVAAAAHGGACELIEDRKSGFLTPVGDVSALAQVLDTILDMPQEEKNKIAECAQNSVRSNYSIQKMCERTLNLYQDFLK